MSARKKRPRPKPAPDANAARAGAPRHRLSRGLLGPGVAAVSIVIALIAWLVTRAPNGGSGNGGQLAALPAPRDSSAPRTPAPAEFAGAVACASCHTTQYAAWRTSTHGTAGGAPGDVKVIAPFDGTPIHFRDAVVIPAASGRRYTFLVRQDGRSDRTFSVDGVVGGVHMAGGGTQGFVSWFPD